jgi:hypothetical protein
MKAVFWIMLVANLVFFAIMQWGSHWFAPPALEQAEPELNPQKIVLQKLLRPAVPTIAASEVATSSVLANSTVVATSAVTPVNTLACMEWAEFSAANLTFAQSAVAELHLTTPATQRKIEYSGEYWVYLPPLKNQAKVKQKLAELKKLGLTDFRVVEEIGQWERAISLGTFDSLDKAKAFSASLPKVVGLNIGEYRSPRQTTVLVLNALDGATLAKLTELQKRFPQSNLNNISCR